MKDDTDKFVALLQMINILIEDELTPEQLQKAKDRFIKLGFFENKPKIKELPT